MLRRSPAPGLSRPGTEPPRRWARMRRAVCVGRVAGETHAHARLAGADPGEIKRLAVMEWVPCVLQMKPLSAVQLS